MGACDEQVAAVTGSTSRIGLAAARGPVQEGAPVAICGRTEESWTKGRGATGTAASFLDLDGGTAS